ncbi:TetR/AcrR family transcriptional regulator [Naumannella halotolerans]|uniref:TetR/AcrR family transcriptional regulator n=1 Tax=Naumannella halotolerans TaxID=993414 RepID=UPI00370D2CC6
MPKIEGGSVADHRQRVRRRLIAALRDLLAEKPFGAISYAELARRSGIGRSAIYNHFPDRERLLAALAEDESETATIDLGIRVDPADDPREQLAAYVAARLQHRQETASTGSVPIGSNPSGRHELLDRILQQGITSGVFRPQDLAVTVPMIDAAIDAAPELTDGLAEAQRLVVNAAGARWPSLVGASRGQVPKAQISEDG